MSLTINTHSPTVADHPAGRTRTAMFVDFDNVFSGLLKTDRAAAISFAEHPERWLAGLQVLDQHGCRRDLLVRRAYLNPHGSVEDPAGGKRLQLARYRNHLTRAGFEVVDSPSLSAQHKNAADIRIVLDVMTALDMPVTYDEFIIASSDSDFTPLLQRLRALDRTTTILTSHTTCAAYRNVAHNVIDTTDVAHLTRPGQPITASPGESPAPAPVATCDAAAARQRAAELIHDAIRTSTEPLNVPRLASNIRTSIGPDVITSTKWFGHRTFGNFLRSLPGNLQTSGDLAWDPERHQPPTTVDGSTALVEAHADVRVGCGPDDTAPTDD